ncbi:MAG TPA: radical SAM protein, partial [Polyangiaceae bacterium]|nr:radical SAM protein [Polyangiaceae bacterium]
LAVESARVDAETHPNWLLLGVELAGHCDLRCRHCLRSDLSTVVEFDLDLFQKIADQAVELGRPSFAFTGGEVTLHSRFFDFLRILEERSMNCHFVTNGNSYPRIRQRLLRFRDTCQGISMSIDGATEASHDGIRGKGSFKRVLMAAALARRDGHNLTVQMVVGKTNRHELAAMVKLCENFGIDKLYFAHVQPVKRAEHWNLPLSPNECREVEREVRALADETRAVGVTMSSGHSDPTPIAHCQTLKHISYNIDCHGRMTFCCQLSGVAGHPDEADVLADLRTVRLWDAIERHLTLSDQVTRARLAYLRNHENDGDPYRDFHCHFCLKGFGKLAHIDPTWQATLGVRATDTPTRKLRLV